MLMMKRPGHIFNMSTVKMGENQTDFYRIPAEDVMVIFNSLK